MEDQVSPGSVQRPGTTRSFFKLPSLLNDRVKFHSFKSTDCLVYQTISLPISCPSKAIWESHQPTYQGWVYFLSCGRRTHSLGEWLQHPSAQVCGEQCNEVAEAHSWHTGPDHSSPPTLYITLASPPSPSFQALYVTSTRGPPTPGG